jgi:hypothetical protein
MHDYLSSLALLDDLYKRKINCYGTVRHSRKLTPPNFGLEDLKMNNIVFWARGNLRVVYWKERWEVCVLTNIRTPPAEGNSRDECGNTVKPLVIEDYSTDMCYVNKSDRMSTSYGMSRRMWKRTKKLFLFLTGLAIVHTFIILQVLW